MSRFFPLILSAVILLCDATAYAFTAIHAVEGRYTVGQGRFVQTPYARTRLTLRGGGDHPARAAIKQDNVVCSSTKHPAVEGWPEV